MVKTTLNLTEEVVDYLKQRAKKRGTTITNSLRDAISMQRYIEGVVEEGAKILIERDGQVRELVLHY